MYNPLSARVRIVSAVVRCSAIKYYKNNTKKKSTSSHGKSGIIILCTRVILLYCFYSARDECIKIIRGGRRAAVAVDTNERDCSRFTLCSPQHFVDTIHVRKYINTNIYYNNPGAMTISRR